MLLMSVPSRSQLHIGARLLIACSTGHQKQVNRSKSLALYQPVSTKSAKPLAWCIYISEK